jgi:hypothetical protein
MEEKEKEEEKKKKKEKEKEKEEDHLASVAHAPHTQLHQLFVRQEGESIRVNPLIPEGRDAAPKVEIGQPPGNDCVGHSRSLVTPCQFAVFPCPSTSQRVWNLKWGGRPALCIALSDRASGRCPPQRPVRRTRAKPLDSRCTEMSVCDARGRSCLSSHKEEKHGKPLPWTQSFLSFLIRVSSRPPNGQWFFSVPCSRLIPDQYTNKP